MNKNSALALLCAAVALPCAASATTNWTLTKGEVITAMPTAADDYNIYFTGTSSQRARIGDTDNKWIHYYPYTLTLKADGLPIPGTSSTSVLPTNWNFLGCFEMDLKAASGNINIIKNETSSAITYQIGHIDVINSVENSTAKAVIDAGGGRLLLQGGSNIQTPTLNLNVNTTITTTSTHAAAIELNQYSAINLAAGKTLSTSNKVTMLGGSGKGSNITTGAGSTLSTFATFTMGEYSSVNIGGTWTLRGLSMSNSASADVYYFNPGSGFTVTLNKGTSLITRTNTTFVQTNVNGGTLTQNAGTATTLSRWFTLQNGGNFSTAGYVKIDGNSDPTHAAWAKLTIAADAGNFFIDDTAKGQQRCRQAKSLPACLHD
ncbi:MAG: hypothetical protein IJI37_03480, partial [Opitutales bacterium]|nr:hypothetical protein [Opitutales bacterium]